MPRPGRRTRPPGAPPPRRRVPRERWQAFALGVRGAALCPQGGAVAAPPPLPPLPPPLPPSLVHTIPPHLAHPHPLSHSLPSSLAGMMKNAALAALALVLLAQAATGEDAAAASAASTASTEHGGRWCRRGETWCDGACRPDFLFRNDRRNCGKASECFGGAVGDGGGTARRGGACRHSHSHCCIRTTRPIHPHAHRPTSQCNFRCWPDHICERGRCRRCPRGTRECANQCRPDRWFSTVDNCGRCGNRCRANQQCRWHRYHGFQCVTVCPTAGDVPCNGQVRRLLPAKGPVRPRGAKLGLATGACSGVRPFIPSRLPSPASQPTVPRPRLVRQQRPERECAPGRFCQWPWFQGAGHCPDACLAGHVPRTRGAPTTCPTHALADPAARSLLLCLPPPAHRSVAAAATAAGAGAGPSAAWARPASAASPPTAPAASTCTPAAPRLAAPPAAAAPPSACCPPSAPPRPSAWSRLPPPPGECPPSEPSPVLAGPRVWVCQRALGWQAGAARRAPLAPALLGVSFPRSRREPRRCRLSCSPLRCRPATVVGANPGDTLDTIVVTLTAGSVPAPQYR